MSLVEMIGASKTFQQGQDVIQALQASDFAAEAGEFVAVIGPSGSGKSTFLTLIGGLQSPTAGQVRLDGNAFSSQPEKTRAAIRYQKIGFILQASNLVPFLNVGEQFALHNKVNHQVVDVKRRTELLEGLGLSYGKYANKYPAELSGGERQRVAIALALYHDPVIVLADEPTASLDTEKAYDVVKILRDETHRLQKATIMVTHDSRLLAYCDRVIQIRDGQLTEIEVPESDTH